MAQVLDLGEMKRDYSARLKRARKRLGWTQQEASNELGVVLRTYQHWEDPNHPAFPDGENAIKVQIRMKVALVGRRRDPDTARYLGEPDWAMPDETLALAAAMG
jgi:transcriptional regulator with XRE-family HTH domain